MTDAPHPYADLIRAHRAARIALRNAASKSRRADEKAARRRQEHLAAVEAMKALDASVGRAREYAPGSISDEDLAEPKGILETIFGPDGAEFQIFGVDLSEREAGE